LIGIWQIVFVSIQEMCFVCEHMPDNDLTSQPHELYNSCLLFYIDIEQLLNLTLLHLNQWPNNVMTPFQLLNRRM